MSDTSKFESLLMAITLRPFEAKDIPSFHRLMNIEALAERLPHSVPYSEEQAEKLWESVSQNPDARRMFAIEWDGAYAGNINSSRMPVNPRGIQFGYWIDPDFQRRGIGTEAVRHFCANPSFPDVLRLQALIEPDNVPSQKILERNGFEREGLLRSFYVKKERPIDVFMYARITKAA